MSIVTSFDTQNHIQITYSGQAVLHSYSIPFSSKRKPSSILSKRK